MPVISRPLPLVACLTALLVAGVARPSVAADWRQSYVEPAVQAWMGLVTLLAEDGERPRPPGPRGDALAKLDDIVGRLSRIEAMLAGRGPMPGRGPGGPSAAGRGEWRGRGGLQASPEMRAMMEARMKEGREKMKAAREKWEQASPEEREEMKKQWQARMKEGREKMEKARAEKGGQSENPDQMRQAMDRVREEGRKRMEEAKAKMEEARKRFQEMEQRVKRLEAEVARMKKAAEKGD